MQVSLIAALAGVLLASGCGAAQSPTEQLSVARTELVVPFGPAPTLDGKLGDAEWSAAVKVAIGSDVTLRLMHDGARVYFGVARNRAATDFGFACLLVAEPQQIRVMHASAKLGSAIYRPGADRRYQPQFKTYTWRSADEMMHDEGWMGTTVSDENRTQQELAVSFAALGLPGQPRPLAVGYVHIEPGVAQPVVAVWPAGLDDGVANGQLLAGFNPDSLAFSPQRWMVLQPQRP